MPPSAVHVTSGSRLHYGLISIGDTGRQFGGVGVMIEPPCVRLHITRAARFETSGPGAERVRECVRLWLEFQSQTQPPACQITVDEMPTMHVGLGTGTQLGLSVARGLNAFCQLADPSPDELARSVQRGRRSAVGTHGFLHGGLVYEEGKAGQDSLGSLNRRLAVPEAWRFVLIQPPDGAGLSGHLERDAFARLPAVPLRAAEELRSEVIQRLLPAAERGDFDAFAHSVYRFGHQAGLSFATTQGGAYNGPRLTQIVRAARALGVAGVGQSSWGPTIFALSPDHTSAQWLADSLRDEPATRDAQIWISRPRNEGASVEIEE
jgi:beta-RFAP synthase